MSEPVLLQHYQQQVEQGLIQYDTTQQAMLQAVQRVYNTLMQKRSLLPWRNKHKTQGLYVYGSVGIGKTFLMNLFFDTLPLEQKQRWHYHDFMRQVHADLTRLKGKSDPLQTIARHFSQYARVLCLDEMQVSDIADAMLLAGLFENLFARGVVLITTANTAPDDLYAGGLQRSRFLPAIELIKQACQVLCLDTEADYRLQTIKQAGTYFQPLDETAEQSMQQCFHALVKQATVWHEPLTINNREIACVAHSHDVAWFDFAVLCVKPRSQLDYLKLAERFTTILLSGIPALNPDQVDQATYLIKLVDVLYDCKVKLIASAAVPIDAIYSSGRKVQEFIRTRSRLHEMQSVSYLQGRKQVSANPDRHCEE